MSTESPYTEEQVVDVIPSAPGEPPPSASPQDILFSDLAQFVHRTPDDDDGCPDDLIDMFDQFGLSTKAYEVTLLQNDPETGKPTQLKVFNSCYPDSEWLKLNYGPGEYTMRIRWKGYEGEGEEKKQKRHNRTVSVSISPKCRPEFVDYQLRRKVQRASDTRQLLRDAKIEQELDIKVEDLGLDGKKGGTEMPKTVKQEIENIREMAELLGFSRPNQIVPQPKSFDVEKWAPLLATALPLVVKFMQDSAERREKQFQTMLTVMQAASNTNSQQVIELIKAQSGPASGNEMMKEFSDMIKSALNIKELFEGKKETLADRLFGLVEGVAPMIATALTMPRQQQLSDPRVVAAKAFVSASPDFQELRKNPLELKKFIDNMDSFYGWLQTDMILEVASGGEIQRPADCPRDPSKQFKQGDPRNRVPDMPEREVERASEIVTEGPTQMFVDAWKSGDAPPSPDSGTTDLSPKGEDDPYGQQD